VILRRLTLVITWPQSVVGKEDSHAVAAQVHGVVSRHASRSLEYTAFASS
jgi:hypothetical protein